MHRTTRRSVSACSAKFGSLSTQTIATHQITIPEDQPLQILNGHGEPICYLIANEHDATLDFYGIVKCDGVAFKAQEDPDFCINNALWVHSSDNHLYFGYTDLSDRRAGPPGRDGIVGWPGPIGALGDTGRTGDTGPCGDTGLAGPDGPIGKPGEDGKNGSNNTQAGAPGVDGARGPTGDPGTDGFIDEQPLVFINGLTDPFTVSSPPTVIIDGDVKDLVGRTLREIPLVIGQTIRTDVRLQVTAGNAPLVLAVEVGGQLIRAFDAVTAEQNHVFDYSILITTRQHETEQGTVIVQCHGTAIEFKNGLLDDYQQFTALSVLVPKAALDTNNLLRVLLSSTALTMTHYSSQVYVYVPSSNCFLFNYQGPFGIAEGNVLIDENSINSTDGLPVGRIAIDRGHSVRLEYDGFLNLSYFTAPLIIQFLIWLNNDQIYTFTINLNGDSAVHFEATIVRTSTSTLLVHVTGLCKRDQVIEFIDFAPVDINNTNIDPVNVQLTYNLSPPGATIQTQFCSFYHTW